MNSSQEKDKEYLYWICSIIPLITFLIRLAFKKDVIYEKKKFTS